MGPIRMYPVGVPTRKLVLLTIAWVLAAVTIGLVVGVLLTEIMALAGAFTTGSDAYRLSLNIIALVVFVAVVTVPFVFRDRFRSDPPREG